jgi:hypothetical protein
MLMQLCDNSKDDAMRVKCIGALECLAQCPEAVDANRVRIPLQHVYTLVLMQLYKGHRNVSRLAPPDGIFAVARRARGARAGRVRAHRHLRG